MVSQFLLTAIAVCAVVSSIYLHALIKEKYIKPDVFLQNAVNKALDEAIRMKHTTEIKAYKDWLEEIKRKM